jgi:CubicO group peptidase (beta-lactamase class C family)
MLHSLPMRRAMTVTSRLIISSIVSVTLAGCGRARTEAAPARVDRLFAQWNVPASPGCSVAISRKGSVLYAHGYGMASVELNVPITPATVMGAASISKQFTAMSVLLLAQRGTLSLDDDVSKYIPEWADRADHVTIRHLLTHTSGLREGFSLLGLAGQNPFADENEAMVRMMARQQGVDSAAGTEFQYNNGAYNLLGSIVKRVSGQSLRDFEQENIFKPLGMSRTQIRDSAGLVIPNRSSGYTQDTGGLRATSEVLGVVGNAGLYTTPGDLLRWEQNFTDPRVGTSELLAAMQTPVVLNNGKPAPYGFGFFLESYRGLRTVEHSGSDRGISANLIRFPDQNLAIALLCNSDAINPIDLTQQVADIYLEGAPGLTPRAAESAPAATVNLPESELRARAGLYRNSSASTPATTAWGGIPDLEISERGGKLIGHSYYSDDADFDLTMSDERRVRSPGGSMFEFAPTAAAHPQEWRVTGTNGGGEAVFELVNVQPQPAELTAFASEYWSGELQAEYGIALRDSALAIRQPGTGEVSLVAFAKDTFVGSGVGIVKFFRDARGAVAGFTISRYNVRNVRFERVKPAE